VKKVERNQAFRGPSAEESSSQMQFHKSHLIVRNVFERLAEYADVVI
jgi:hypothetical protein